MSEGRRHNLSGIVWWTPRPSCYEQACSRDTTNSRSKVKWRWMGPWQDNGFDRERKRESYETKSSLHRDTFCPHRPRRLQNYYCQLLQRWLQKLLPKPFVSILVSPTLWLVVWQWKLLITGSSYFALQDVAFSVWGETTSAKSAIQEWLAQTVRDDTILTFFLGVTLLSWLELLNYILAMPRKPMHPSWAHRLQSCCRQQKC